MGLKYWGFQKMTERQLEGEKRETGRKGGSVAGMSSSYGRR